MATRAVDGTAERPPTSTERVRRWRERNPERTKELALKWGAENRDQVRAACRGWYAENRDYRKAYAKKRYAENSERIRADRRAYYQANRKAQIAAVTKWVKEHPEENRAKCAQRRARIAGAEGELSAREFIAICELQEGLCAYCGEPSKLTMDHVIPLTGGGAHDAGNVVGACFSCNASKGNRPLEDWLDRKETKCTQSPT